MLHNSVEEFDKLFVDGVSNGVLPKSLSIKTVNIPYTRYHPDGHKIDDPNPIFDVLETFHSIAALQQHQADTEAQKMNNAQYPRAYLIELINPLFSFKGKYYLGLAQTGMLVRASGQVR